MKYNVIKHFIFADDAETAVQDNDFVTIEEKLANTLENEQIL